MACDNAGEFYIDDQLISEVEIDDQPIDFLEIDDVCVWRRSTSPSMIIFDVPGNYTWDCYLHGVDAVNVCMIGGGGSGMALSYCDEQTPYGGGYAGTHVDDTHDVEYGNIYHITVGRGGQPVQGFTNGEKGEDSVFETLTAEGGNGGAPHAGYNGSGGEGPDPGCTGNEQPFHDGTYVSAGCTGATAYGGQASQWGDGGDASHESSAQPGEDGDVGAGGGSYAGSGLLLDSGAGGRGEVRISWGDASKRRVYRISELLPETLQFLGVSNGN